MPNNLSILRDLGRARRERLVDQGSVTEFEPVAVSDYVLGQYLNEALPAFLQPRLQAVRSQLRPRELQSLLLTTRIYASATPLIKPQIERLASDETVPTGELARRAAAIWYDQLDKGTQAVLRRRFNSDIIKLGSRLNLNPASDDAAHPGTLANRFAALITGFFDRLLLRIRG